MANIPPTELNLIETDDDYDFSLRYATGVSENRITFKIGNITEYEVDAIVCPWLTERPEDGFYSRNIYNAGGPGLHAELQSVWPSRLPATNSILTGSHGIQSCKHIIHVREPLPTGNANTSWRGPGRPYWSPHKVQPLKNSITACLIMAVSLDCKTIAIPPLGIRRVKKPVETPAQPPPGGPLTGTNVTKPRVATKWPPAIAAQAILEAVGEFRATSPFRDRLEEIVILFTDLDGWGREELAAYRCERQ